MFRDADLNPVSTIGARSNPTNTTCAGWMRRTCSRNYSCSSRNILYASESFNLPLYLDLFMTQILLLGAGNYDDVALMMTLSSPFMMHAPGARPGTVLPEPYSFYWQKQQMAAFQLIRGKHAFFGTGWAVGLVHEWRSDLCELRPGIEAHAHRAASCSPLTARARISFTSTIQSGWRSLLIKTIDAFVFEQRLVLI
jgi:hypothetical protein